MRGAQSVDALARARRGAAFGLAVAVCCTGSHAAASPQWHVALSGAGCHVSGPGAEDGWSWCGSASGHALFLRTRDRDFGVGPYARVLGILGDSASASAGLSALVPLSPTFPFILSAGAVATTRGGELGPGADLWLFWGPTSYNFHSSYSMASGILLGAQRTWGSASATAVVLGAQLDLALAVIPFIALFELLSGPPQR